MSNGTSLVSVDARLEALERCIESLWAKLDAANAARADLAVQVSDMRDEIDALSVKPALPMLELDACAICSKADGDCFYRGGGGFVFCASCVSDAKAEVAAATRVP